MRKTLAVLILSAVCVALLFAQNIEEIFEDSKNSQAPAISQESVVTEVASPEETTETLEAPVQPAPVPVVVDVVERKAEIDEIGISAEPTDDAQIDGGHISLNVRGEELRDVIRMFSRLSNANIIVPDLGEEVEAKQVDINLDNVEWKPALQAILDTHSLELYEKIPGTEVYSIRVRAADAPEPSETQVFKLSHTPVGSVTNIIADLIGETGSYATFPERNVVVVQGTAQALQNVSDIVEQIDLPRPQVFIEAKFMELTDSASKRLGIDWQVLSAYGVGVNGINGSYNYSDSKEDSITRTRTSTIDNKFGENRFRDVEGRPYENLIEDPPGLIDYAARPDSFGLDSSRIYGITPTTFTENLTSFFSEDSVGTLDATTVTRALGATLTASDFELILSALKEESGVDIVSNPKIIVANEEKASIHIGDKEPNIRIERTAGTTDNPGGSTTVGLDKDVPYFEDGVKVVVKPTINTASNITIRIVPELTSFIDRKAVVSSDGTTLIDFPVSRTKRIETVFSLESGQTAAIGGLTQTDERNTERKIPWLGSIPFLGRLFSYEEKIFDQNETIIFVTVALANPANIDVETGLPSGTRLAQRRQIKDDAEYQVHQAELNVLRTEEISNMEKEIRKLRETNRKLIEKQQKKDPVPEALPVEEMFQPLETDRSAGTLAKAEASEDTSVEAIFQALEESGDTHAPVASETE